MNGVRRFVYELMVGHFFAAGINPGYKVVASRLNMDDVSEQSDVDMAQGVEREAAGAGEGAGGPAAQTAGGAKAAGATAMPPGYLYIAH